jgi:predicted phosphohydrolase
MPIAWISDPHLDHLPESGVVRLLSSIQQAAGDVLVVTGDTSRAATLVRDLQLLADAAGRPLYFVLGNHDHYGASVETVRDQVTAPDFPDTIRWLPPAGVITMPDGTALVGVDGWADGRHGDMLKTPLVLNDDRLIGELAAQPTRIGKLAVRRALADADAARLKTLLQRAVAAGATRVVVATHVPPFLEALAPGSRIAHRDWRPLMVCGATGEVLERFASETPAVNLEVIAGHTHATHQVVISHNLKITVSGARYGQPSVVRTI